MSSVIPDTVSPSFFIFSAAISACLTSSISSQVRSLYSDGHPFWKKSFITSPRMPYFSPTPSPRYNSSKLICAISAPPLQYTTVPQKGAEVQIRTRNFCSLSTSNLFAKTINSLKIAFSKQIKNLSTGFQTDCCISLRKRNRNYRCTIKITLKLFD